jgi:putative hydrolase of the HAD superfamily
LGWDPCFSRGRAGRGGTEGAGRTVAPAGVHARYGVRVTRAPLALPGQTVIFDYGEVISLTPSPADRAVIARLAGVSGDTADGSGIAADRFWAAYFAHRDGLDQGTADVAAYWRAIAAEVGARWDEGRVHELWAADFRSWLSVNPGTVDVLADLRAGGTPLALLSNAGPDFGSYFRHGPLRDFFSAFYVSGELGLIKPQAAIYQHALDDLAITPAEAVFIDNREPNVAGAEALGITGHVFTDAGRLRAFLTSLAVPASAS